jgi:hypothetical protein
VKAPDSTNAAPKASEQPKTGVRELPRTERPNVVVGQVDRAGISAVRHPIMPQVASARLHARASWG